ncbi:uncharacterized protein K452DRAFT_283614 [Neofusicoccum parvum]|nr:uncharacterized protein K452DRAFT_283614 [Neofusicoccum parvum]
MSGASNPTTALQSSLQSLISAIEAQPEFAAQESQRKGKVFFMWDFVSNTKRMLDNLHITPDSFAGDKRETKSDVMQRAMFANILFNDTTGKLTAMCGGDTTEFNADVKAKSEDCQNKAGEWGISEGLLSG